MITIFYHFTLLVIMAVRDIEPEWQTLNQRITQIVRDPLHPVGATFNRFCQQLQIQYQRKLRTTENMMQASSRFMTSYNEFYVISEQDLGMNKVYLEEQRNIIMSHLYLVSGLLADHFAKHSQQMFIRKAR